jgi:excisionase family DNA binding protein
MEQAEITPRYLTYRQAKELTGLSRQTVWRLIKSGHVRAFKIGRSVKIERRSLEAYVQAEPVEAK